MNKEIKTLSILEIMTVDVLRNYCQLTGKKEDDTELQRRVLKTLTKDRYRLLREAMSEMSKYSDNPDTFTAVYVGNIIKIVDVLLTEDENMNNNKQ